MSRRSWGASGELAIVAEVVVPLIARGLIVRRPWAENLLERVDGDRRAIRRLQAARERYGPRPLPIRVLGREIAIVLTPEDAHRILDAPPDQMLVATREKRAALSRFQPHGVLASAPAQRPQRRRYNEEILQTDQPVHKLAEQIAAKVAEEAQQMLASAMAVGELSWPTFAYYWWRLVRRIVLGDQARDDQHLLNQLTRLRRDANWAYLAPRHDQLRRAFQHRLDTHLRRCQPGSLAAVIGPYNSQSGTSPGEQVPQWLFAFDGAAMATFRAFALIDAHPDRPPNLREQTGADPGEALTLMGPTLLESLRLWPTTPAILRETTTETNWTDRTLPPQTTMLIYTPLFHRDPQYTPDADAYVPELWSGCQADPPWAFAFSAGHAACPGRQLVTLVCSILLTCLLHRTCLRQAHPNPIRDSKPLPAALSPFRLRYYSAAR